MKNETKQNKKYIVQSAHNPVNRLSRENKFRTTNKDFILLMVCVLTNIYSTANYLLT